MPLDRPGEVRWFDVDPGYVFHVGNAHTDAAGRVVLDAARYARRRRGRDVGRPGPRPRRPRRRRGRHRCRPAAPLGARPGDRHRRPRRRSTTAPSSSPPSTTSASAATPATATPWPTPARRRDRQVRRRARAPSPSTRSAPTRSAGEAVFVPRAAAGRAEDDGWLLTITTRRDGSASQLLVLDATDVAGRAGRGRDPAPRGARRASTGRGSRTPSCRERACELTTDTAAPRTRPTSVSAEGRERAARRPSARLMLRGLAWDVGLPVVGLLRAAPRWACRDWVALLVASRARGGCGSSGSPSGTGG